MAYLAIPLATLKNNRSPRDIVYLGVARARANHASWPQLCRPNAPAPYRALALPLCQTATRPTGNAGLTRPNKEFNL
eukprot:6761551-Lingulodinium_polyedra.AAC.1